MKDKLSKPEVEYCKCEPHFEIPYEIRCSVCHKVLKKSEVDNEG